MSPFRFLQFAARATWFQTAFAGALGTAILIVLYIAAPPILTRLDLKTYDMLLPLRASSAPSRVPFIVDIDERSLEKYGQWPWPRYLMADLVNALKLDGVSATGFDIMFAERDKSSPEEMRARL
ncbi:MAG: CHASE2 domain-containing protein, partial [Synergistaceae bacterium]|nr:CHASE2 domain-containing protein [Synergistaceae bacterium]